MSITPIVLAATLASASPDAEPPSVLELPGITVPMPLAAAPSAARPSAAASPKIESTPPLPRDEHSEIEVRARGKAPPGDPLQELNIKSYEVVQALDKAVIAPVANGYTQAVPAPLRHGLHNVLVTLEEPTVFLNFLLQHKIGKAAETLGRTVINLTLGLGGLIDVAGRKAFKLPHRPNGFGDTMGFYGIKSGAYLFLPFFGATSVRDFAGRMLDLAVLPTAVGKPFKGIFWTLGHGTSRSIDDRVELDLVLKDIRDNSPDPYSSMKDRYLKLRQSEIDSLHGKAAAKVAETPKKAEVMPPVLVPEAK